jgi:diguanylate cyclase (GGDEF)-like protein
MGGDEFVVLLSMIKAERDAQEVAEKIRFSLNQPFHLAGHSLGISSSTGIAIYPQHGEEEKQLLRNADDAMYYAKSVGRDNVQIYRPDMPEIGG